jgi:hypothetical protein
MYDIYDASSNEIIVGCGFLIWYVRLVCFVLFCFVLIILHAL